MDGSNNLFTSPSLPAKPADLADGDNDRAALSGEPRLIWQPTLTLWHPGNAESFVPGAPSTPSPDTSHFPTPWEPITAHRSQESGQAATVLPTDEPGAAPIQSPQKAGRYIYRHWRGQLPLAETFWLNALPPIVLNALVCLLPWDELVSKTAISFVGFIVLSLTNLIVTIGYLGGVWRASSKHGTDRRGWPPLARAATLLMSLGVVHLNLVIGLPQALEIAHLVTGTIPTGDYEVRLAPNGKELEVAGTIGVGLTKDLLTLLDRDPAIRTVQLNSHGGSARESRKLRDLIVRRKLSTSTFAGCFAECVFAYVAGEQRSIGSGARLGFRRAALPGMPQWALWRDYEQDKRHWLAHGVSAGFIDQALTAPEYAIWQPSRGELLEAKIVTTLVSDESFDGSAQESWALLDGELTRTPFLALLKEQEPESYQKLRTELYGAMRSLAGLQEFHLRIPPLAKAAFYERLSRASDASLLEFAEVNIDMISVLYSAGANVCNGYYSDSLDGLTLERAKYLPDEIQRREYDLIGEIIQSARRGDSQPPAKADIGQHWDELMAQIAKRYGDKAGQFFEAAKGRGDVNQTCHVFYDFYKSVSRLPGQIAGPLLRYHFAQLHARSWPQPRQMLATRRISARAQSRHSIAQRVPH